MQYNVSVNANDGKGGNTNQSVLVEATNIVEAIDKAKVQLLETIRLSGLQIIPAPAVAQAPEPTA